MEKVSVPSKCLLWLDISRLWLPFYPARTFSKRSGWCDNYQRGDKWNRDTTEGTALFTALPFCVSVYKTSCVGKSRNLILQDAVASRRPHNSRNRVVNIELEHSNVNTAPISTVKWVFNLHFGSPHWMVVMCMNANVSKLNEVTSSSFDCLKPQMRFYEKNTWSPGLRHKCFIWFNHEGFSVDQNITVIACAVI